MTKSEEVELFRAASARVVERAKKDRLYALAFLRRTGYFDMYPERDNGEDLVAYPPPATKPEVGKTSKKRTKTK